MIFTESKDKGMGWRGFPSWSKLKLFCFELGDKTLEPSPNFVEPKCNYKNWQNLDQCEVNTYCDATPSSLIDSIVNPNVKTIEG